MMKILVPGPSLNSLQKAVIEKILKEARIESNSPSSNNEKYEKLVKTLIDAVSKSQKDQPRKE